MKCNRLLLRSSVSRPTINARAFSTNGNNRSTDLLVGAVSLIFFL
jgi:hypothetical protein